MNSSASYNLHFPYFFNNALILLKIRGSLFDETHKGQHKDFISTFNIRFEHDSIFYVSLWNFLTISILYMI